MGAISRLKLQRNTKKTTSIEL
ncbi:UNVERIFIED_CONTAM: hypothetical protein GTU68_053647 [Idotea baltica]|nr:hypothetical protein [Idotea baltica]